MIGGDDGGSHVTTNGGRTWSEQDQPTAQFYRLALDNDFPYNIYGAQQDNSTIKIPSRSNDSSIGERDWYDVGGGESGWIAPHPDNSNIIFAGSYGGLLTRYDHVTGQTRNVNVYPDNPLGAGADVQKYRFQWNFPIIFSPHKTEGKAALYAAANVLFRSTDEGSSWQPISGDLTRNDKSKQGSSGGLITQDNTSVEYYCTIFTVSESSVKQGVIWTGSDDGLVNVSQDSGKTWSNVTPKDFPEWTQINAIDTSSFDAGTAYIAATAYKSDNYAPFLFKTADYGKTWKKIVNGIPGDAFTRVVREDPNRKGLLVAGTETGLFYSVNDGENWSSLQLNLPIVPITDLQFQKRDKDLVVATQGRSFYVLDNLPHLYELADAQKTNAYLFKIEDTYRRSGFGGFGSSPLATVGKNPPTGVVINYYFKDKPNKDVAVEILDSKGIVVRTFKGKPPTDGQPVNVPSLEPSLPMEAGYNQFVWNFRLPNATTIPGMILWAGSTTGPKVAPGKYQIRMTYDGKIVSTESFDLRGAPRLSTTQEDFQKQFDLRMKIHNKLTETHDAILEIRDIRKQFEDLSAKMRSPEMKDLVDKSKEIIKNISAVEEELNQTKIKSSQDALNFPIKVNNKLAALASSIDSGDYAPTTQSYEVYNELAAQIDSQLTILNKVRLEDIAAFNKLFAEKNVPVITTKKKN
jgi:ferritin-like metal-binding protein YciE